MFSVENLSEHSPTSILSSIRMILSQLDWMFDSLGSSTLAGYISHPNGLITSTFSTNYKEGHTTEARADAVSALTRNSVAALITRRCFRGQVKIHNYSDVSKHAYLRTMVMTKTRSSLVLTKTKFP